MPKHMKTCRVCGNQYSSCKSIRTGSPIFNWREVACSPECGEVYLLSVKESRSKARKEEPADELCIKVESEYVEEYIVDEGCDNEECGDEPF